MGLDMYLCASQHVSGYSFAPDQERKAYEEIARKVGLLAAADPETPSLTVQVVVAYWRKANAIHNWFVMNCQDGEDDCREALVSRDKLRELRHTCREVLDSTDLVKGKVKAGRQATENGWEDIVEEGKTMADTSVAEELLPPVGGFFFGGTAYDEWYYRDLQDTVEQIDRVLANTSEEADFVFVYRSSW